MTFDFKEVCAGLVVAAAGLLFLAYSIATLSLGTAFRMGPGYFPAVLGGLLAVIGICIVVSAAHTKGDPFVAPPLRGILLTTAATVAFGFLTPRTGMIPALIVTLTLAAYASERMTARRAAFLVLGLTAFCVLVFKFGLNMPLPLFSPWFAVLGL